MLDTCVQAVARGGRRLSEAVRRDFVDTCPQILSGYGCLRSSRFDGIRHGLHVSDLRASGALFGRYTHPNTLVSSHAQTCWFTRPNMLVRPHAQTCWLVHTPNTCGMAFACRPGLAQHAFIKSLQLESINPSAWVNLGGLYLHRDKLDLANKASFVVVDIVVDFCCNIDCCSCGGCCRCCCVCTTSWTWSALSNRRCIKRANCMVCCSSPFFCWC
jgi:hypothetical protein